MATYNTLKTEVLVNCDHVGSTDAGTVVEYALRTCVRYISSRTELPKLRTSKTYTVIDADITAGSISITGASKLNATDYSTPNRLFIRRNSAATAPGQVYDYSEHMHYLEQKAFSIRGERTSLYDVGNEDLRPAYAYTIDADDNLIIDPIAVDNVITFYYMKEPAAYGSGTTPEIPSEFQYILVNGATLILKEWIREPDQIIDPHTVLASLNPQIEQLDLFLHGRRKRSMIKLHPSYWTK